jgi:membrane-bound ClpP family serine protease
LTKELGTKRSWIAALYQWTTFGVGTVGLVMGILGLCLNAANYLILKGIAVPMPVVGIVFIIGVLICIAIGWAWEHYKFWEAVNTRSQKVQNKEFIIMYNQIHENTDDIKKLMKHFGIEEEKK